VNKKEAKKTFVTWVRAGENARASDSKSFLLLFFKKRLFSVLSYPSLQSSSDPTAVGPALVRFSLT